MFRIDSHSPFLHTSGKGINVLFAEEYHVLAFDVVENVEVGERGYNVIFLHISPLDQFTKGKEELTKGLNILSLGVRAEGLAWEPNG